MFRFLAALVFVAACQSIGHAQTACCTDSSCTDTMSGIECTGLGGVLLPGELCEGQPCGVGACCTDVSCGHLDAFGCITGGREFGGAGSTCQDDPCGIGTGACCNNGSCSVQTRSACEGGGGYWLGAATMCETGQCVLGACCRPGLCEPKALYECEASDGAFVQGGDCSLDACAVEDNCPSNSLYAQPPDDERTFTAYASELSAGYAFYDRFTGVSGAIEKLSWFGFDLQPGETGILECVELTNQFDVVLYENNGGQPGAAACEYQLTAQRINTGLEMGGFLLNEYRLSLPSPCVLTDGWLSIVGRGSSTCWFYWITSSAGDTFSNCEPCDDFVINDLSFCLQGSAGGHFGACCDTISGECADEIEISHCAGLGYEFDPDVLCDKRDAVCEAASGACCFGDDHCASVPADQCSAAKGVWMGANSTCDRCPAVGACCFDFDACALARQFHCEFDGFPWLGPETNCGACPTQPECPLDSFFSQQPDGPSSFLAGTSEASRGLRRFEDYSGAGGSIESLRWWGFDLEPLGGSTFRDCTEADNTFDISFHADAGGTIGPAICAHTLTATRTPTGILYLGTEMNAYEVQLPQPCVLVNGWISIVGRGDPTCTFLWQSAGEGGSQCQGCASPDEGMNLAVCISGTPGDQVGACCDEDSGSCLEDVNISNCAGQGQRFLAGGPCAIFDPPCGSPVGPCCRMGALCELASEAECAAIEGSWLGGDGLCEECPCDLTCSAESRPEGEPICQNEYVDSFNGGCFAEPAEFSQIRPCDEVCGTSGFFEVGGEDTPDTDWYRFHAAAANVLTVSLEAEFPALLAIVDISSGCDGAQVLNQGTGVRCERITLVEPLAPGDYALLVLPNGFQDFTICGSMYTMTTSAETCPGDFDGDGDVDAGDWHNMAGCLLGPGTDASSGCEPGDFDGDGDVDCFDAGTFMNAVRPQPQ